ncbi:MAG: hypothetical protein H6Q52_2034 [Deltaproteobacteria bacterium]|nr:hypothetical protein [Deltaproteobacteria bacterium]
MPYDFVNDLRFTIYAFKKTAFKYSPSVKGTSCGWSIPCVYTSRNVSARCAFAPTSDSRYLKSFSERWAEHEQVRRIPPGISFRSAISFIDLYPARPSCFFLRSLMNAGGSSMIASKVFAESLRYFFTSCRERTRFSAPP